jgi:hypothetical protein
VIVDGNFIPTLTTTDSTLCLNEIATLTVPAGYTDYTWSSGETGVNSIQTTLAGDFYVDITNQYGCLVSTNSITISVPQGANPPAIVGDTICEGETLFLSTPLNQLVSWYSQDTLLLQTSTLFTLNQLQVDTMFLVAFQQSDCPMAYQTVTIDVINHIDPSTLINDSLFCSGTSINYTLIDSKLYFEFKHVSLYTDVSNILNTYYMEAGYVTMPGRWAKVGIDIRLKY